MNKKILIGSILAIILVLVSLSSLVSAQSLESTIGEKITALQELRERDWEPGEILGLLALIFIMLLTFLTGGYWGI